ncbi:MAG TPA: efflux RND transporter permease subunit [Bryobacteraceae bacterium]|nr:efflux RND transporter permease subunit [Bryobacteraceae bacterium]
MWIVKLALWRPYTFIVLALLLFLISPVMLLRTPIDIFPAINIPVISVIWTYTGLVPSEMSSRIVSIFERSLTTTVSGIEHIESQSLNGVAVVKVFLQPSADINGAISAVIAESEVGLKQFPPGITPPLVLSYNASSVPIVQLGLGGKGLSEQQLNDLGMNFIRPQLATIQGAAVPLPYGGKVRQVMVDIDSHQLMAKGLSPMDVVNAVNAQNVILPSGTAKIGRTEYNVALNGTPSVVQSLNDLPVKVANGGTIYVRDVANVRDGYAVQTNIVRQDGQRGVLLTVQKSGNASTLSIVSDIYKALPKIAATLPSQLSIKPLFDQSVFVRASLTGVVREASIAACLTSLMILLFMGSWRSTLIIAISIPLSILTSLLILSVLGETINIMTLGGLALAVGILVDDATVEIENVERQLGLGKELHQAILDGAQQIAVPAFVSTLSIGIVFVPMFFLTGVARYLFVPLAEAVVFALFASYFFSRTIIPTLVMYMLGRERENGERREREGRRGVFTRLHAGFEHGFETIRNAYANLLQVCLDHRGMFAGGFLIFCAASLPLYTRLGQDFFPSVDAGEFRLHLRAKTGTRIEETARITDQVERAIRARIPASEMGGILDNIGLPVSGINLSYSNSGVIGNADAEILVSLASKHRPTEEYVAQLRDALPKEFPGTTFFFQPADIVSQILNFGLPAPIDIQVIGSDVAHNFAVAASMAEKIRSVPGAVDVHVYQLLDQPRIQFDVDRVRTQQVGLNERDVASNALVSLSSSFQTSPNFWLSQNGVAYNIAVQTPQYKLDSLDALRNLPINSATAPIPQLLDNLTSMTQTAEPAVVSHYNVQPVIDVYASVQGRDLGGVASDIAQITTAAARQLPHGSTLVTRGQVSTMHSSFIGLIGGLAFAIALVYLLIVVNFQSWTEAFIVITALPGALAGIAWMLFLTRTTLSVPALMGTIMSMGVATANSVLVITFANEKMAELGNSAKAALEAGSTRLRPVMMTALAMIIGMVPMALSLGEGGEQNAPLGRAVIGGLLFATIATLFFVPVVFSIVRRNFKPKTQVNS